MRIFRAIDEVTHVSASAVTVGTFDGFHRGHRVLVDQLFAAARPQNLQTVLVTFDPHPRRIVDTSGKSLELLSSTSEKIALAAEMGIDFALIIPFSKEFAGMSSGDFVKTVLVDVLRVREMIVGYDHHFGRNREGGIAELKRLGKQLGFGVQQVSAYSDGSQVISSSLIRGLLQDGNVAGASLFLGRPYSLSGTVLRGHGRGRQLGFPTANVQLLDSDKLIPAHGVYAIEVTVEQGVFNGMMNIGVRPTFEFDSLTLEAHLFNFNDDLYGKPIDIRLLHFIRPEQKFAGPEALREQLYKDKIACEKIVGS